MAGAGDLTLGGSHNPSQLPWIESDDQNQDPPMTQPSRIEPNPGLLHLFFLEFPGSMCFCGPPEVSTQVLEVSLRSAERSATSTTQVMEGGATPLMVASRLGRTAVAAWERGGRHPTSRSPWQGRDSLGEVPWFGEAS